MLSFVLLVLGLTGLWIGAELTINGALAVARHFKLSQVFMGLTVVALGTDLPELFVDITAAIQRLNGIETSDIIIGETVGTTLSQTSLMLGIAALIGAVVITKRVLVRDGFVMLASVVLLFIMGLDGMLSRLDGCILVFIYLIYFAQLYREEKVIEKVKRAPSLNVAWAGLSLVGGVVILLFTADLTLDSALELSELLGVSETLVGLFMVGLGTSLPELATSVTAVRKKASKLAAAGLIGSNIYDMLFTLGIGTAISGFSMNPEFMRFDIPVLFIIFGVVLWLFRSKLRIEKREGMFLIGLYVGFLVLRLAMSAYWT